MNRVITATGQYTDGEITGITVDGFPEEIDVSCDLLIHADPRFLRVEGDAITIEALNGRAIYHKSRYQAPELELHGAVRFERREWRLEQSAAGSA